MIKTQDRIDGRLGSIPERKFEGALDKEKIPYSSTRGPYGFKNFTNELDKIYGDYIIIHHGIISIDVKGRFITRESILSFKGDYYVLYDASNESAKDPIVLSTAVLKDLTKNWDEKEYWEIAAYGNNVAGVSYSRLKELLKNNMAITLEEFLN